MHSRVRILAATPRRTGLALVCAALLVLPVVGHLGGGFAHAAADAAAAPKAGKTATTKRPAAKNKKKKAEPAAPEDSATKAAQAKRRRIGASPAYVVGDTGAHFIDENAPKIVAFPQEAKAVEKAFAETRRDQLLDAEKAARAAKSPDRWRTVLFMLRGLHDRSDPEACFWRVLAFYRIGEVDRARAVRENCDLPGKDSATLNSEDAVATGVPAIGTVPREDQFSVTSDRPGESEAKGVAEAKGAAEPKGAARAAGPDAVPYTGPGPQRYK